MKTRLFTLAVLGIALTACTNDNENLNDGPVAAQFIADIHKAVSTRVNSEGTGFTDGDRIGITGAGFTNVPYVRKSGQFVPDGTVIYFNDTETKTFNAYYPYQADGGTVTVSTAADKQGSGMHAQSYGELHRRHQGRRQGLFFPPLHEPDYPHLRGRQRRKLLCYPA